MKNELTYTNRAVIFSILFPKIQQKRGDNIHLLPKTRTWLDAVTVFDKYFVLWYNVKINTGFTTSCERITQEDVIKHINNKKEYYRWYVGDLKGAQNGL